MAALVKYADSDSTKDPVSYEEKATKGKKNDNDKGHQHNPVNQGGNKRKADEFVANTNAQGHILWLTPILRVIVVSIRESRHTLVWWAKI